MSAPSAPSAHEDAMADPRRVQAPRECEPSSRSLADAAPVLIWTIGADGRCTWANAQWLAFTGRTLAQELGDGWAEGIHPDDRQRSFEAFLAAFPARRPFSVEHRIRHADGGYRWLLVRAAPQHDCDGALVGYVGSSVDVTRSREAEERLRQSEGWLRAIFMGSPLAIGTADLDGKILDANPAMKALVGYEDHELRGQSVARLMHPDRAEDDLRAHRRSAAGDRSIRRLETRWIRKDGAVIWVSQIVQPVLDDAGRPIFVFVMAEDITARKQADEAIQRERRRYLSLMAIAQDGVHVLDEDGLLIEANAAFLELLGETSDVVGRIGMRDWIVELSNASDDELRAQLRHVMEQPRLLETTLRRSDGTFLDVEAHVGGVELEGRRYVLASARDITARRALEGQVALKHAQLEELNRSLARRIDEAVSELRAKDQLLVSQSRHAAMGEMIGNIAHQWRQPLNALALIVSDLGDASRFGELDQATLDEAVEHGKRLIQKMSSTINDFRDFFRPEKEKRPFSAWLQVQETLALLAASLEHAGVVVDVELAEPGAQADLCLFGFANEYSQVLLNLLANARQAMQGARDGGGRIRLRLWSEAGLGCVSVRDEGGGVPEGVLDRIFEPYFSTKEGGTGIGLYLSRQIAERSLGGRLDVANVAGGAEFTLRVPLARPLDAERGPSEPEGAAATE